MTGRFGYTIGGTGVSVVLRSISLVKGERVKSLRVSAVLSCVSHLSYFQGHDGDGLGDAGDDGSHGLGEGCATLLRHTYDIERDRGREGGGRG